MADDGKLYSVYNDTMVQEMRKLIAHADIIKPNYTEASFLLGHKYEPETVDEAKIRQLCKELHELGPRHVIMSGVPHQTEAIVAVYDGETDELQLVSTSLVPVKAHGTGDIFTAVLTGALMQGYDTLKSAEIAANFTTDAVKYTHETIGSMRDGLLFERLLGRLTALIK